MKIIKLKLPGKASISWYWPLRIVIGGNDHELKNSLKNGYWANQYTQVVAADDYQIYNGLQQAEFNYFGLPRVKLITKWSPNIIILPDAQSDDTNPYPVLFQADVIILPFLSATAYHNYLSANTAENIIDQFTSRYAASCIFILVLDGSDLSQWIEEITIKMSHDQSLIGAFEELTGENAPGMLIYDPSLNWDNPLNQSLNNILDRLKLWPKENYIGIQRLGPEKFTPRDLIYLIENNQTIFQFDGESHGAATINELSRALSTKSTESETPLFPELGDTLPKEGYQKETASNGNPALDGYIEFNKNIEMGNAFPDVDLNAFEETEVYTNAPPTSSAPTQPAANPQIDAPRYLQAQLAAANDPDTPLKNYLLANQEHLAKIRIGYASDQFLDGGDAVDLSAIFKEPKKQEETIVLHIQPSGCELQIRKITVPRTGNSTEAIIKFKTENPATDFYLDIKAFYENKMIQWVLLKADILIAPDDKLHEIVVERVITIRKNLDNLSEASKFNGSIIYDDSKKTPEITGMISQNPIPLRNTTGLKEIVKNIRNTIENAARNIDDFPEDLLAPKNVQLLEILANQGNSLFEHFVNRRNLLSPIQVVANQADFVPINFVYDLNPPEFNATLCAHAKAALLAGKCRNCFDKEEMPAKHICPFGFWGFSKIIEYHRAEPLDVAPDEADFIVRAEPSNGRNTVEVFKNIIYGSASRVDAVVPGSRKMVAEKIATLANSHSTDKWKDWVNITTTQNPDSIVLIVHVEKDAVRLINMIEIGNNDLLPQNQLSYHHISQSRHPIAIVIGCEAADINNQGFDVGSQFITKGASMVITNFTKIKGSQAAKIMVRLMDFFEEYKGKEVIFGEIMLKLKQRLLADGIMVGMSLVTYGDADWKIRI